MDEDSAEDDLKSHKLTLSKAVNMVQNWLLWRLLPMSGASQK